MLKTLKMTYFRNEFGTRTDQQKTVIFLKIIVPPPIFRCMSCSASTVLEARSAQFLAKRGPGNIAPNHSMDQCRFRPELSETFGPLVHALFALFWRDLYGTMALKACWSTDGSYQIWGDIPVTFHEKKWWCLNKLVKCFQAHLPVKEGGNLYENPH